MELDELKEENTSQLKAWKGKEQKWEERADDKERYEDVIDSLNMDRAQETESWRKQLESLELEKKGTKEAFGAKLKNEKRKGGMGKG